MGCVHDHKSTRFGTSVFLRTKKLRQAFCSIWCVFFICSLTAQPLLACVLSHLSGSSSFHAFLRYRRWSDCTAWKPPRNEKKKANAFSMTFSSSAGRRWLLEKSFAFPLKPELFSCCWRRRRGGAVCCFVGRVEESLPCGGVAQSVLF